MWGGPSHCTARLWRNVKEGLTVFNERQRRNTKGVLEETQEREEGENNAARYSAWGLLRRRATQGRCVVCTARSGGMKRDDGLISKKGPRQVQLQPVDRAVADRAFLVSAGSLCQCVCSMQPTPSPGKQP